MKKTCLIGCGSIAANHLIALSEGGYSSVTALCDIRPERAEAYREKYAPGAVIYTDYRKMLEEADYDVVHITTPHYLHCEMACAALALGKNVFLEKPMAISEDEIRRMLAAEEKSSGKITVCFQNRFNGATLMAKALADSLGGVLSARGMVTWKRIAPYYTESGWRGSYTTEGGGVMINQAIHSLDLLLQFCGTPRTVIGTTANHHLKNVIEVEDTCELQIGFDNGVSGTFFATTAFACDAPNFLELTCAGNRRITMLGDRLYLDGDPVSESEEFRDENTVTPGKQCWGNGHKKLIAMFYRSLEEGKPVPVSLRSAADAVRVLLAAYKSSDRTIALSEI